MWYLFINTYHSSCVLLNGQKSVLEFSFLFCVKTIRSHKHVTHIMRNPCLAYVKNKAQISCSVTGADQHLCFRFIDSTILLLPYLKFQASIHLLWLYSPVCFQPSKNPKERFYGDVANLPYMYFSGPLLLQACGSTAPAPVSTSDQYGFVRFRANGQTQITGGFSLNFEASQEGKLSEVEICAYLKIIERYFF